MEIRISEQIIHIEELDKSEIGTTELSPINEKLTSGVSRMYRDQDGAILLEYYNRKCLKIKNWQEYTILKNVDFLFSYWLDKFTYIFEIDEIRYQQLVTGSKPLELKDSNVHLGDYYFCLDGNLLLKGKKYWARDKYYLLERVETLIALNTEYASLLKDRVDLPEKSIIQTPEIISEDELIFEIQLLDGHQVNVGEARELIGEHLNIPKERLDYSIESLKAIDDSWMWNNHNGIEYFLRIPCLSYVSECILRTNESFRMLKDEEQVTYYLIDETGKVSDISSYTLWMMIDTDNGVPSVYPVYESVMLDLRS